MAVLAPSEASNNAASGRNPKTRDASATVSTIRLWSSRNCVIDFGIGGRSAAAGAGALRRCRSSNRSFIGCRRSILRRNGEGLPTRPRLAPLTHVAKVPLPFLADPIVAMRERVGPCRVAPIFHVELNLIDRRKMMRIDRLVPVITNCACPRSQPSAPGTRRHGTAAEHCLRLRGRGLSYRFAAHADSSLAARASRGPASRTCVTVLRSLRIHCIAS